MEKKEAMKILKDFHDKSALFSVRTALDTIIPELAESEDEKIRKELITWLQNTKGQVLPIDRYNAALTWLEKQGKEKSWKPSKEEMDVLYGLAYITNQYDEHKEEVITRLYQDLKREFFNGSSYENMFPNTSTEDDVRRRSTIQVLEYARTLDTYNQYGKADIDKNIAWLEKQGEQTNLPKFTFDEELAQAKKDAYNDALETEDTVKDLEKSKKRHSIDDIIDYLDNIEKGVELLNNKIK